MMIDAAPDSVGTLLMIFWSVLASLIVTGLIWSHYSKKLR